MARSHFFGPSGRLRTPSREEDVMVCVTRPITLSWRHSCAALSGLRQPGRSAKSSGERAPAQSARRPRQAPAGAGGLARTRVRGRASQSAPPDFRDPRRSRRLLSAARGRVGPSILEMFFNLPVLKGGAFSGRLLEQVVNMCK